MPISLLLHYIPCLTNNLYKFEVQEHLYRSLMAVILTPLFL